MDPETKVKVRAEIERLEGIGKHALAQSFKDLLARDRQLDAEFRAYEEAAEQEARSHEVKL